VPNFIESFFRDRQSLAHLRKYVLEKNLNKKHWVYFNLVDLLSPLYPSIKSENLQSLSFACYGYFRAMLVIDQIVDDPQTKKGSDILVFILLFESCIKELSFLFHREDTFWKSFDNAKSVYFKAIKFEKTKWNDLSVITEKDFEKMAEDKSASMCYPLIDALESLQNQGNRHNNNKLLKSFLKHLHIAFQYQDDLDDFKKDRVSHQRTYAQFLVDQKIIENGLLEVITGTDMLYKYLFVSGIASRLLKSSCENLGICMGIANQLNLKNLEDFTQQEFEQCAGKLNEVELLVEKTKIKIQKSNTKRFQNSVNDISIDSALTESIRYLERCVNKEMLWTDFMTTAGTSKYWVTFYIAYQLADAGVNLPIMNELSQRISNSQMAASYNETIPEDGDTLNFMIGFIKSYDSATTPKTLKNWLDYLNTDGGWFTYKEEAALRTRLKLNSGTSLIGWLTPKVCVSATACKMLSLFEGYNSERKSTEDYLLANQTEAGYWNSYWWTSPIYATSWSIRSLSDKSEHEVPCSKARNWLLQGQLESGAWINSFTNEPSAFYTALAVKGLLAFKPEENLEALEKAISWLMCQQTSDGSWQTSRILAIPATDIQEPSKVLDWRKSSFGVNIVVDDHNRVFTTSTVINVLSEYKRKYSKL